MRGRKETSFANKSQKLMSKVKVNTFATNSVFEEINKNDAKDKDTNYYKDENDAESQKEAFIEETPIKAKTNKQRITSDDETDNDDLVTEKHCGIYTNKIKSSCENNRNSSISIKKITEDHKITSPAFIRKSLNTNSPFKRKNNNELASFQQDLNIENKSSQAPRLMLPKTNKANSVLEMPLKVIENSQNSGIQKDLHLQLKMKFQKSLEPTDLNFCKDLLKKSFNYRRSSISKYKSFFEILEEHPYYKNKKMVIL